MNERKEAMTAAVQAESGASQTGLRSPEQGCKHTEGLWRAKAAVIPDNVGGYDVAIVAHVNGTDAIIAECFEIVDFHTKMPVAANAARIVQCVNSHDDLVAALEAYLNAATFDDLSSSHDAARAALLKARGEA